MKKIFTILALTIVFNVNAQISTIGTDNSGYGSSAMGSGTTASGIISTAMGSGTTASAYYSTAMGDGTTASGNTSTAMGRGTIASGSRSTAMGYNTIASGSRSTAMGSGTTASGYYSTAMGYNITASDYGSLVIGQYNSSGSTANSATAFSTANTAFVIGNGTGTGVNASDAFKVMFNGNTTVAGSVTATAFIGDGSQLTGLPTGGGSPFSLNATSSDGIQSNNNTASGNYSTAMGESTTASDFGSLVIGRYNSSGSSVTGSATAFDTANTAFVIGNGADTDNKADAFKVMFNGDTTIGNDLTVSGDVVVSSDARLKANIVSLGATLAKLLLIDGKSYTMKKDGKQKIGVLAQDIQKVFPELVSTDDRDMLAVNYQGLVPVLINALKEQDAKMNVQQAEIDRLKEQDAKMKEQEERLERLEAIISKMDK